MVYREPAPGPEPTPKYICNGTICTYPLCECGHPHDVHHWFNSEFIGCPALGYYDESIIKGERVKHQLKEICKCQRYSPQK
jgi:hypothetical protein